MDETKNLNLLLFSNLNIPDIFEILNYYMSSWKEPLLNNIVNKQFYLGINEEFDSYQILPRYKALSKLFFVLLDVSKITSPLGIFDTYKELLNKEEIIKAYEYGIFESLTSNLSYFYSKFIQYNENSLNLEKCELIFFIKINAYLLYIILFTCQNDPFMIKQIKYNSDNLEETILKFIKQYTHKYVPIRILLCLYTFIR